MDELQLNRILTGLAEGKTVVAWPRFLNAYSSDLLKVVKRFTRNEEDRSDCFLFVCEKLSQHGCRRLKRFVPNGAATFSTWLYAVVFNLCRDWWRTRYPRRRVFRSVARLSQFDQDLFRLYYQYGLSSQETLEELRGAYPNLSPNQLGVAKRRVLDQLTIRQRRFLLARQSQMVSLFTSAGEIIESEQLIVDEELGPGPSAEHLQSEEIMAQALQCLDAEDLLILRLRFERDLTLAEVARIMGLANPQAADRKIRKLLESLRKRML